MIDIVRSFDHGRHVQLIRPVPLKPFEIGRLDEAGAGQREIPRASTDGLVFKPSSRIASEPAAAARAARYHEPFQAQRLFPNAG